VEKYVGDAVAGDLLSGGTGSGEIAVDAGRERLSVSRVNAPVGQFEGSLARVICLLQIHGPMKDAQHLNGRYFHTIKYQVITKEKAANPRNNFISLSPKLRMLDEFQRAFPKSLKILVCCSFVMASNIRPNI
jgi:hypothetical protein